MLAATWRVYVTRATNATAIAELKFFDASGVQIPTTGGTASASSTVSTFVPANAFDGNPATFWAGTAATGGPPQWLQYAFPSAVDVASISMTDRDDISWSQAPVDFSVQYSTDGGSTWNILWQYYGVSWFDAGWTNTFDGTKACPALGIAYRLYITANNGQADGTVAFRGWVMYDSGGNALDTSRYATPVSSQYTHSDNTGYQALASSPAVGPGGQFWASLPGTPVQQWIAYIFADPNTKVAKFCIKQASGQTLETPTQLQLQSSTDLVNWVTLGTYTFDWSTVQRNCAGTVAPLMFFVIT